MKAILFVMGMVFSAALAPAAPANEGEASAAAALERLKALEGVWEADLGGGHTATSRIEVLAGGSVVIDRYEDSELGAGKAMVTVYHLDGSRLLLTHYCMAGNQPRMELEAFEPESGELRFEFVDATGLATPDAGHMHRASYRLEDPDHFSTIWDWVEKGKTTTQEVERFTRVVP